MNYEPRISKKKKKTIYLIITIIATVAIGGMVYWAWPKNSPKTETKSTTEQKISQLQQQLSQIKNALTTLNHNITQTESSLQQKRTQQSQTPQNNLQTQISQLESQLTTYKSQKKKLEIIIPKLEQQITNLNKGENISEQEQIINEIEKEIKEINEELGNNKPEKDDEPTKKPNFPPKENDDLPNEEPKPKPEEDNDEPEPKKPEPSPQKTPEEEWEKNKSQLIAETTKEIHASEENAKKLFLVFDNELKDPNWHDKLINVKNEEELNQIKTATLKDVNEIRIGSPGERLKLKEYFIFRWWEVKHYDRPDKKINVRGLDQDLINDLSQAIKDNPHSTWQRKYMVFVGDFKINNDADATKFDDLIKSDAGRNTWIVIKKNHNPSQYSYERNYLFLKKGEPDYHEFKTRKEAIDWLRQNDSYFK